MVGEAPVAGPGFWPVVALPSQLDSVSESDYVINCFIMPKSRNLLVTNHPLVLHPDIHVLLDYPLRQQMRV
jgi:hypothetical protein